MGEISVLEVPRWVLRLVDGDRGAWRACGGSLQVRSLVGDGLVAVSVRRTEATGLAEDAFRRATIDAYEALAAEAARCGFGAPPGVVRMWNLVPRILEPLGGQPHRYMAFNAGRYDAYLRWYGDEVEMVRRVATATGVGHRGADLVLHALVASGAGTAIDNPRQKPPHQYSRRFGLLPPCFARATRLERATRSLLLVGGTASVVGEDSAHGSDVEAQLLETTRNLEAVARAGTPPPLLPSTTTAQSVRVYYVREADRALLERAVPPLLGAPPEIEYVVADLCRPELLVELEAVYSYPSDGKAAVSASANRNRQVAPASSPAASRVPKPTASRGASPARSAGPRSQHSR